MLRKIFGYTIIVLFVVSSICLLIYEYSVNNFCDDYAQVYNITLPTEAEDYTREDILFDRLCYGPETYYRYFSAVLALGVLNLMWIGWRHPEKLRLSK